jgi:hypothetical protein
MKELVFKLKTNNEVLIDIKTTYFMKDDVINFTHEDNIYRFNTTKKLLNKENKESIMNIDMLNNKIIYVHKELGKEFELPLDSNDLLINDNNVKYTYEIKDNDIANIIEISY